MTLATARLPIEGNFPSLAGATAWLNSPPLTPEGLRGKVVLVDIWTYTCINWLRTLPYVRAWAAKYKDQGLVVIGVHSPEFPFEKDLENVRRSAKDDDGRLSDRGRQRPRGMASLQQRVLAGPLPHRREGPHSVPPVRRGRIRTDRDRSSSSCSPRRGLGAQTAV